MTAAFTRPKVNPPRFFGCVSPKQQGEGGEVFTNEAADGDEPDILFLYEIHSFRRRPRLMNTT